MGRIRLTRQQAQEEAARLAVEYVATLPQADTLRLRGGFPDTTEPQSKSSKHRLKWIVMFEYIPPEGGAVDGEFMVSVDLESGIAATHRFQF